MRLAIFALPLAAALLFGGLAYGANSCARECSADYRADMCACHRIGTEEEGGDNKSCVQDARDDYGTCLGDCSDPLELILSNNAVSPLKAGAPGAFSIN